MYFPKKKVVNSQNDEIFNSALTNYVQEANLIPHRVGVHLAHVPSLVGLFDVLYPEHPFATFYVRNRHSVILGDYVRLYR